MCEDMCKEVGSYPECPGCPNFVPPDPTPGVMTWDELLTHMDNLSEWGRGPREAGGDHGGGRALSDRGFLWWTDPDVFFVA